MKINDIETFGTNPHLFIYKPKNNRYVNKTCDEIIWESFSNQTHMIFHDRTKHIGTFIQINLIEGIRIIRKISK